MPLVAAQRRYALSLLPLSLLGLVVVVALLLIQAPPALRGGGLALAALLVAIFAAMGITGLAWTWLLAWPQQRGRLASARQVQAPGQLPALRDTTPWSVGFLVAAGLLLGALLWTALSTLGFVAAPMLWLTVGVSNLEMARLLRRIERRACVTYYVAPPLPFLAARQQLFMLPA